MKRKIINIDQEKCTGCGLCIPKCPEGAIQLIDGKARLVSDLLCDGLGACLGHCPEGAITIEEREAEKYDEAKVMEKIVEQGPNVIKAHLNHLKDHGQTNLFEEALAYLKQKGIPVPEEKVSSPKHAGHSGCPGSRAMQFSASKSKEEDLSGKRPSQLRQWPIQLHLVSSVAPYYQASDVILVADCVGYALGDFHKEYLKGKSLAIACPKLDENQEIYQDKLVSMIEDSEIKSLTVMIMTVPCCYGLLRLAQEAIEKSKRKITLRMIVVSLQGEILKDQVF